MTTVPGSGVRSGCSAGERQHKATAERLTLHKKRPSTTYAKPRRIFVVLGDDRLTIDWPCGPANGWGGVCGPRLTPGPSNGPAVRTLSGIPIGPATGRLAPPPSHSRQISPQLASLCWLRRAGMGFRMVGDALCRSQCHEHTKSVHRIAIVAPARSGQLGDPLSRPGLRMSSPLTRRPAPRPSSARSSTSIGHSDHARARRRSLPRSPRVHCRPEGGYLRR